MAEENFIVTPRGSLLENVSMDTGESAGMHAASFPSITVSVDGGGSDGMNGSLLNTSASSPAAMLRKRAVSAPLKASDSDLRRELLFALLQDGQQHQHQQAQDGGIPLQQQQLRQPHTTDHIRSVLASLSPLDLSMSSRAPLLGSSASAADLSHPLSTAASTSTDASLSTLHALIPTDLSDAIAKIECMSATLPETHLAQQQQHPLLMDAPRQAARFSISQLFPAVETGASSSTATAATAAGQDPSATLAAQMDVSEATAGSYPSMAQPTSHVKATASAADAREQNPPPLLMQSSDMITSADNVFAGMDPSTVALISSAAENVNLQLHQILLSGSGGPAAAGTAAAPRMSVTEVTLLLDEQQRRQQQQQQQQELRVASAAAMDTNLSPLSSVSASTGSSGNDSRMLQAPSDREDEASFGEQGFGADAESELDEFGFATSSSTVLKKAQHTMSEKMRRRNLNDAFDNLARQVPSCDAKAKKIDVLNKSAAYIAHLKRQVERLQKENIGLKETIVERFHAGNAGNAPSQPIPQTESQTGGLYQAPSDAAAATAAATQGQLAYAIGLLRLEGAGDSQAPPDGGSKPSSVNSAIANFLRNKKRQPPESEAASSGVVPQKEEARRLLYSIGL